MGEEGTGGSVHLLCLAASSGVPLFCRSSRGGAPSRQQLPFSVIGSLNGVHMFGQNLEVQLSSARTKDTTVEALSGFAEAMGTGFVSLMVSGRVVSATEGWWRLGTPEAVLLPWLVGSLPPQAARDYPVYLPHGSPTVPHRLLTLTLLPGLELCLLCGPRPPLSQLGPQLLERWWQPVLDPLRACLPLGPRGLPYGFPLHKDILGLLLLHLELKRCLFTVEPLGDKGPSPEQRRRLLRHFYALVTSTHFPPEPLEKVEDDVSRAQLPRACYLVLGPGEPGTGLRLIALQLGLRLLLLLLAPQSPTHGLRSLATHTLHTLSPLL
uniref:Fuzzy planar cell polarity protein n=1 Tax=Ictidomys tridecemlineatus TaxID=43179 RepID=A0A287D8P7_ICTTR